MKAVAPKKELLECHGKDATPPPPPKLKSLCYC